MFVQTAGHVPKHGPGGLPLKGGFEWSDFKQ